jgi:hypothetical protein
MFKELFTEAEEIIFKGSEAAVQKAMDKLHQAYESGELPWQEYNSFTKDHKTYQIVTDDPKGYKKYKTKIKKIIGA